MRFFERTSMVDVQKLSEAKHTQTMITSFRYIKYLINIDIFQKFLLIRVQILCDTCQAAIALHFHVNIFPEFFFLKTILLVLADYMLLQNKDNYNQ